MTEPILTFANVSKSFKEICALEEINFSINQGEFLALIGPSGCGKSTVLRLASGLEKQTTGEIDLLTKKVGYVFQDANLMPWRTVRKNIGLLAELEKFDREKLKKKTDEVLKLVGFDISKHGLADAKEEIKDSLFIHKAPAFISLKSDPTLSRSITGTK